MLHSGDLNFSASGLKTAVMTQLRDGTAAPGRHGGEFQAAAVVMCWWQIAGRHRPVCRAWWSGRQC